MFATRAALLLAIAFAGAAADLTPAQRQANIDSFEQVWKAVRERHWETNPGGLDWQAVHDELRPQIDKANSIAEARKIMSGMLGRLHQTHFGIFPADVYDEFASPGSTEGQPGIDVRVLDGHAIVTGLEPDSPAAKAGVKPGWEILRVDDREMKEVLQLIQKNFKDSTLLDLRLSRTVLYRLTGPVNESVHVEFLDGGGQHRKVALDRVMPRGTVVKLGSFPPFYFWLESKKVRPDVEYIRFNAFFRPGHGERRLRRCREELSQMQRLCGGPARQSGRTGRPGNGRGRLVHR